MTSNIVINFRKEPLQVYGENHPNVALIYENIGATYQDSLKDNKQARIHLDKALVIYQKFDRQKDISDVQARLARLPSSDVAASAAIRSYPGSTFGDSGGKTPSHEAFA